MSNHRTNASLLAILVFGVLTPVARPDEKGFVPLFPADGEPKGWSARRWNDVSQPAAAGTVWKVKQGVLHGSDPRGTWLVSDRVYRDFELEFEWKVSDRGNSGCGLRFPLRGDPAFDGMELQMVDPRYYPRPKEIPASELTAALYRAVTPTEQRFKPNEWNRYRVRCVGSSVQVELNGKRVLDVNLDEQTKTTRRHDGSEAPPLKDRPRRGHIGFQELSRDGHVQIRKARIKPLD